MLFNSLEFILGFFPVVLIGWYGIWHLERRFHGVGPISFSLFAKIFLLCASLFFYGYFKPSYLLIIVASIIVNYCFGIAFRKLESQPAFWGKVLLGVALVFNLGIIGYYKYWDFVAENLNASLGTTIPLVNVLLPLGISFFTFQQISFVVDCYCNPQQKNYGFWDYALFVCYFPQLIAGPIVTHDELVPQFQSRENKRFNPNSFSRGLYAFSLGLAKKVLIADTFGKAVNYGFGNVSGLNSISALLVMLGYTFQIYFDFSGYCDMATGCGLMMNIRLPMNFNSPYRALSISEFWKRWHMTLTRFFTRYIYIPLGGNRKSLVRTCINIFIVYICSGIWHGANWTFILWGLLHGVACIVDRLTKVYTEKWHPAFRWVITFIFVNIAWIYFRADSISQANILLSKLIHWEAGEPDAALLECFFLPQFKTILYLVKRDYWNVWSTAMKYSAIAFYSFAGWASLNMLNTNERIDTFHPTIQNAVATILLFVTAFMAMSGVSTFLYFNF